MNPNMNYGAIIPSGPYTATSAKDLKTDGKAYGRGVGMITLIEVSHMLVDYLILLENFPNV